VLSLAHLLKKLPYWITLRDVLMLVKRLNDECWLSMHDRSPLNNHAHLNDSIVVRPC
jgi:hypothetical protein